MKAYINASINRKSRDIDIDVSYCQEQLQYVLSLASYHQIIFFLDLNCIHFFIRYIFKYEFQVVSC